MNINLFCFDFLILTTMIDCLSFPFKQNAPTFIISTPVTGPVKSCNNRYLTSLLFFMVFFYSIKLIPNASARSSFSIYNSIYPYFMHSMYFAFWSMDINNVNRLHTSPKVFMWKCVRRFFPDCPKAIWYVKSSRIGSHNRNDNTCFA